MTEQPGRRSFSTAELCTQVGGELRGPDNLEITGVAALDESEPGQITFLADEAHARRWAHAGASAAVISRSLLPIDHDPATRALIVVDNAELATIIMLEQFAPPPDRPDLGVHPTAWVDPSATLGESVRIGPNVTVGPRAVLGRGVTLHPGVHVYANVLIGDDSVIHAGAVIRERCRLGRRVIVHQNASIGADGFGYRPSPDGKGLLKVPQIGIVILEDDVEIGAGTCIDRAKFSATIIGAGTKVDNLVQIAHNCRVGRCCVIAGQSGLAGSVIVEDGVQIGAQVGVSDHVRIGRGARVGGQSGVMQDLAPGVTVLGLPADDVRQTLRQFACIRKLPELIRDLSQRPDAGGEG